MTVYIQPTLKYLLEQFMPKHIPLHTRSKVLKLMLLGYTRNMVAMDMGVSTGTVSNYWKGFKRDAIRMGLDEAAGEYGVAEELSALRALGGSLDKTGLTASQASTGVKVLEALNMLGVDASKLEQFTREIYIHSVEAGHTPTKLVEYAAKLSSLESETGLDYPSLLRSYEERSRVLNNLEGSIQKLRAEEANAWKKRDEALFDLNFTLETLNEYTQVRKALLGYGVEIRNIKRLSTMMKSAKELGFDPERIRRYITEMESLSSRCSQVEERLKSLESEEEATNLRHLKLLAEIKTLSEQKAGLDASIRTLTEQGIKNLEEIRDASVKNMKKTSSEESAILKQFTTELHEILAKATKECDERLQSFHSTMESLEDHIREIRDRAAKVGEAVGNLAALAPTLKLLERAEGEPHEVYPAMHFLCQRFIKWLRMQQGYNFFLESYLESFIKQIEVVMRK